jgi:hypothetical protein
VEDYKTGGLQDWRTTRPVAYKTRRTSRPVAYKKSEALGVLGLKYILAEFFLGLRNTLAESKGLKYNLGLGLKYIQVSKIIKRLRRVLETLENAQI